MGDGPDGQALDPPARLLPRALQPREESPRIGRPRPARTPGSRWRQYAISTEDNQGELKLLPIPPAAELPLAAMYLHGVFRSEVDRSSLDRRQAATGQLGAAQHLVLSLRARQEAQDWVGAKQMSNAETCARDHSVRVPARDQQPCASVRSHGAAVSRSDGRGADAIRRRRGVRPPTSPKRGSCQARRAHRTCPPGRCCCSGLSTRHVPDRDTADERVDAHAAAAPTTCTTRAWRSSTTPSTPPPT